MAGAGPISTVVTVQQSASVPISARARHLRSATIDPLSLEIRVGTYAGPQDSLFGAEYSAIYWLEENGYDVSYISGIDTATNGSLLLNHKVFMDAGHDEYWTDSQVANVQAAANAGVNLAFLSGNEIFWQTRSRRASTAARSQSHARHL